MYFTEKYNHKTQSFLIRINKDDYRSGADPIMKNRREKGKTSYRIFYLILIVILISMGLLGCGNISANDFEAPELVGSRADTSEDDDAIPGAKGSLEDLFTTIDLMDATITDLETEMEAGNVTSEQLTQMYIDRIEAYDRELDLNSIIAINPNALEEAKELDREREEGTVRGPLHGVPIVVKANIDVEGMATSAGARILQDMIADEDAFVIKRLKEAGAVILAQTNMSEFAYATASSRSTLGGIVHNAYDTSRTPAGSSGGTAVAVTCNFAAAGVGTDTGGSIRNPSSFANIYGIRPSKGLVSIEGILPLKAYKDTAGPMARTAEDAALLLEVMAGTDESDDYTAEEDADAMLGDGYTDGLSDASLEGIRIGYLDYSFETEYEEPDPKVAPMIDETISVLEAGGAEIVDLSDILTTGIINMLTEGIYTDTFEYDINDYLNKRGDSAKYKTLSELLYSNYDGNQHMYLGNLTADYYTLADSFEDTPDPYTKKIGTLRRIPDWSLVLAGRSYISSILEDNGIDAVMYLNFFDVPETEESYVEDAYNYAGYDIAFSSKLGLPEIVIPMGFSGTDSSCQTELPLGLSLFAGFGNEKKLLDIAYGYEKLAGEGTRRMPETTPALPDERLNDFIIYLINKAESIDLSEFKVDETSYQTLMDTCEYAKNAEIGDPYAAYETAEELAEAYDAVRAEILEQTNFNIWDGETYGWKLNWKMIYSH